MRSAWVGVLRSLSLAGLMSLAACGGTDSAEQTGDRQLELYSWWTNPGESDALSALLQLYGKKFPQTSILSAKVEQISEAQAQLHSRMLAGNPPDTFQVIGGNDLMQWVAYN